MSQTEDPRFLAPERYRLRRMIEAVRLLPILGVVFLMLPLLWATGDEGNDASTGGGLIYLFVIWIFLILAAAGAARALRAASKAAYDTPEPESEAEGG